MGFILLYYKGRTRSCLNKKTTQGEVVYSELKEKKSMFLKKSNFLSQGFRFLIHNMKLLSKMVSKGLSMSKFQRGSNSGRRTQGFQTKDIILGSTLMHSLSETVILHFIY